MIIARFTCLGAAMSVGGLLTQFVMYFRGLKDGIGPGLPGNSRHECRSTKQSQLGQARRSLNSGQWLVASGEIRPAGFEGRIGIASILQSKANFGHEQITVKHLTIGYYGHFNEFKGWKSKANPKPMGLLPSGHNAWVENRPYGLRRLIQREDPSHSFRMTRRRRFYLIYANHL